MNTSILLLILALIGIGSYLLGSRRAVALSGGRPSSMHSRAGYHGSYAVVWAVLPAAFILCAWLVISPLFVTSAVRGNFPEDVRAQSEAQQSLTYGMVTSIARGLQRLTPEETAQVEADTAAVRPLLASKGVAIAGDPERFMVDAAQTLNGMTSTSRIAMIAVVLLAALGGGAYALRAIAPRFRARNQVEKVILAALLVASSIAILTTIGIVLSMLTEAIQFFTMVPAHQFFFGTVWDPRFAAAGATDSSGQFGLIPLLAGTLYIGFVAMLVAVPVGLFSAIYMSEYASPRLRSVAKPLLEVLAGIPTIVYGFFALTTVGPFLRDISTQINGLATGNYANFIQAQSVITAGFVMGIMLIPYVSSLSDDIITAVPRSLRDGSLGLGATRSETIKRVIVPAALPGIVGAVLMTASRAIGETMIVVLAAGVAARLQLNPFEPMTTVTVKIVSQLTGDLEFTSPQTLVAFALGITLFAITLCLNIYALYIVRKYREQYE
ncbi:MULTISPECIES: phosphate ABC transporter permease subunit PstC [Agrobacterium]|jgi:phosphate transport system permease protein|uniref:Phosphate transport system permease protein n=2 Tax=Agrobacterium tumefaciens complex TaxID=1183400 RepID=A0A1S7PT85_AGRTU|nr:MULTISPECIES: phosphate ABC transporter permease subunit PstC [Agrobacterium]MCP2132950.1 phosphate transport system permease protein [Rhizobium sp. SLBN-94]TGE81845.1 phosphate ABC transporter permease subunit PstC [Rhizobium sp. SEMIA 439]AYM79983.1 phosphate transport system permease protein [Agrobacterium tumefaciens]EHH08154.1 phosphate ABC transporter, permease protein PstC [Agrobacterium tumefaciens CCNWGS0286]KAA1235980.1 phosphate ABC transporter permease subunit PstC [Agrobacteriu